MDVIDTVDWGGIPGPSDWYEPDRVATGLRVLAGATNLIQAAEAGSLLGCGGIVHDHSGAVFPAAAVAAPLLLDIAQQGHPAARDAALGLLEEALSFYPHAGYRRVATPYGPTVPICCDIAHHLRSRADFLIGQDQGRSLLADAAEHWRFEIREGVPDDDGTSVFGVLSGRLPGDAVHAAELHACGVGAELVEVAVEYPPAGVCSEACLRVDGRRPHELPVGAVVLPAKCGDGLP
ncbi:hypothetical protein [Streptomyces pratensis]|uniref:hypothetical protein n=1 Tax=Streptomyces pratensis TaxID=1169025 RepID=UPI00362BF53E